MMKEQRLKFLKSLQIVLLRDANIMMFVADVLYNTWTMKSNCLLKHKQYWNSLNISGILICHPRA